MDDRIDVLERQGRMRAATLQHSADGVVAAISRMVAERAALQAAQHEATRQALRDRSAAFNALSQAEREKVLDARVPGLAEARQALRQGKRP